MPVLGLALLIAAGSARPGRGAPKGAAEASIEARLRDALPELEFREPRFDFMTNALARLAASGERPDWIDLAVRGPFLARDAYRAKVLRQRALLVQILAAVPTGEETRSIWVGGEDLDPVLGRFPWARLEVAVPPGKGPVDEIRRQLIELLEPTDRVTGYVTYRDKPGEGGLTVGIPQLGAEPLWLASQSRRIHDRSGGPSIEEEDWELWVEELRESDPFQDQALLEYLMPELGPVLREPIHASVLMTLNETPSHFARVFQPLEDLLAGWLGTRERPLPERLEALTARARGLKEADAALADLIQDAADRLQTLGRHEDRIGRAREVLSGEASGVTTRLARILEILPAGVDPPGARPGRDHVLYRLARNDGRPLGDVLAVARHLSPWARRESMALETWLRDRIAAMDPEQAQAAERTLRESGEPLGLRTLVRIRGSSPREVMEATGILPAGRWHDFARFEGIGLEPGDAPLTSMAAPGRILLAHLERQFEHGVFLTPASDGPAIEARVRADLASLLGPRVPSEAYLAARELVRASPARRPLDSPESGDRPTREVLDMLSIPELEPVRTRVRDALDLAGRDPTEAVQAVCRIRADLRRSVEDPGLESGALKLDLLLLDLALARWARALPAPAGAREEPLRLDARLAAQLVSLASGLYADGLLDSIELETFELTVNRSTGTGPAAGSDAWLDVFKAVGRVVEWAQSNAIRTFGSAIRLSQRIVPARAYRYLETLERITTLASVQRWIDDTEVSASRAFADAFPTHRIGSLSFHTSVRGLSPGTARGTLHLPDLDELGREGFAFDPRGIYGLPYHVKEITPARGFLTRESGSSLSHVELLARSRGIPSATLAGDAWLALDALEGRPVRLTVEPGGRVVIEVAPPPAGGASPAPPTPPPPSPAPDPVHLPAPDRTTTRLLDLAELSLSEASPRAGTKSGFLAEAIRAGLKEHVPPGLVVPFGVYEDVMKRSGLDRRIERMASDPAFATDPALRARELESLRRAIESASMPSKYVKALDAALRKTFRKQPLFVRSDSNIEDLPNMVGAGLNETVPHVTGTRAVVDAIRRVWASLWSERAMVWRIEALADPWQARPSVLLMPALAATKAGVLVTRDLRSGDPGKMVVSASEGLGFKVVQGSQTPEELIFDTRDGSVEYLRFSKARDMIVLAPGGGVATVPRRPVGKVLALEEIRELVTVAERVRVGLSGFGETLSIEWLFDPDGKLRIVQVRALRDPRPPGSGE